jgi:hypothetical protein
MNSIDFIKKYSGISSGVTSLVLYQNSTQLYPYKVCYLKPFNRFDLKRQNALTLGILSNLDILGILFIHFSEIKISSSASFWLSTGPRRV